jgi:cysteine desulfuration protein SufE
VIIMTALPAISEVAEEYEFLDSEDRYRLLIELGRQLESMPEALKTDATKVRGCSSSTWVYPTRLPDGRLHFLADNNAAITRAWSPNSRGSQDRPQQRSRRPTSARCWNPST